MKKYVIYTAINSITNKVYVGFDSCWPRRKSQHKNIALNGVKTSNAFYNAIRKYGWETFIWNVIYESLDGEYTKNVMEEFFIREYNSCVYFENSNGYNMTLGGEGILGYQKTPVTIESQREKLKDRKQSHEHIRRRTDSRVNNPNNSSWNLGKTKETDIRLAKTAEKISESLKGKPKSEKHKQNLKMRLQDTIVLTCSHCGKIGDYKNMKRWHMDNCKHKHNKIA
jgi:group I intron endonuclease